MPETPFRKAPDGSYWVVNKGQNVQMCVSDGSIYLRGAVLDPRDVTNEGKPAHLEIKEKEPGYGPGDRLTVRTQGERGPSLIQIPRILLVEIEEGKHPPLMTRGRWSCANIRVPGGGLALRSDIEALVNRRRQASAPNNQGGLK